MNVLTSANPASGAARPPRATGCADLLRRSGRPPPSIRARPRQAGSAARRASRARCRTRRAPSCRPGCRQSSSRRRTSSRSGRWKTRRRATTASNGSSALKVRASPWTKCNVARPPPRAAARRWRAAARPRRRPPPSRTGSSSSRSTKATWPEAGADVPARASPPARSWPRRHRAPRHPGHQLAALPTSPRDLRAAAAAGHRPAPPAPTPRASVPSSRARPRSGWMTVGQEEVSRASVPPGPGAGVAERPRGRRCRHRHESEHAARRPTSSSTTARRASTSSKSRSSGRAGGRPGRGWLELPAGSCGAAADGAGRRAPRRRWPAWPPAARARPRTAPAPPRRRSSAERSCPAARERASPAPGGRWAYAGAVAARTISPSSWCCGLTGSSARRRSGPG